MKNYPEEKKCMYCGEPNGQYPTYLIRKAVKPKGSSYRWKYIGYCCDSCHDTKGKPIEIE